MRSCVLLAVALCAADARADRVDGYLDVVPPWIQATVVGKPPPALRELSLSTDDGAIDATSIRTEPEPLTLALVVSGQEVWIGDDELGEEPSYSGALKLLAKAVDASALDRAGPPGSKVVIVSYSAGSELRLPMTDLAKLTGAALGTQRDYYGKIGSDLVQGVTAGLDLLAGSDTPRKALIVIGDGSDTNNQVAKPKLGELAARAAAERVQVFAVIYRTQLSGDAVITNLADDAKTVTADAEMTSELRDISKRLAARFAATFNAKDLRWDGLRHRFVIHAGGSEIKASAVLPVWEPADAWWKAPWRWAVIGVGAVALVALSLLLRSRLRAASA